MNNLVSAEAGVDSKRVAINDFRGVSNLNMLDLHSLIGVIVGHNLEGRAHLVPKNKEPKFEEFIQRSECE